MKSFYMWSQSCGYSVVKNLYSYYNIMHIPYYAWHKAVVLSHKGRLDIYVLESVAVVMFALICQLWSLLLAYTYAPFVLCCLNLIAHSVLLWPERGTRENLSLGSHWVAGRVNPSFSVSFCGRAYCSLYGTQSHTEISVRQYARYCLALLTTCKHDRCYTSKALVLSMHITYNGTSLSPTHTSPPPSLSLSLSLSPSHSLSLPPQTNTFQCILATDSVDLYVIFLYADIQWTTGDTLDGVNNGLGGNPAQVGFNAGDSQNSYSLPGSRTDDIVNIDERSNVGEPGVWVFHVSGPEVRSGGCSDTTNPGKLSWLYVQGCHQ